MREPSGGGLLSKAGVRGDGDSSRDGVTCGDCVQGEGGQGCGVAPCSL